MYYNMSKSLWSLWIANITLASIVTTDKQLHVRSDLALWGPGWCSQATSTKAMYPSIQSELVHASTHEENAQAEVVNPIHNKLVRKRWHYNYNNTNCNKLRPFYSSHYPVADPEGVNGVHWPPPPFEVSALSFCFCFTFVLLLLLLQRNANACTVEQ